MRELDAYDQDFGTKSKEDQNFSKMNVYYIKIFIKTI